MSALYWLFLGVALVLVEMATPGLNAVFFGLAAFFIALLVWLFGLAPVWQWLLFSALSVGLLVLLRKTFKKMLVGDKSAAKGIDDDFTGKHATVTEPVQPGLAGRVEFRGCSWAAESDEDIPVGANVRICSKENLTLFVKRV